MPLTFERRLALLEVEVVANILLYARSTTCVNTELLQDILKQFRVLQSDEQYYINSNMYCTLRELALVDRHEAAVRLAWKYRHKTREQRQELEDLRIRSTEPLAQQ